MKANGIARVVVLAALSALAGCRVNANGDRGLLFNPLIGLIGMAVDGDDKDDYASYLKDDCCDCDGKCCCD